MKPPKTDDLFSQQNSPDLFQQDQFQNDLFGNDPFGIKQIKLSELSIYNWGSFNGLHTAAIHPDGTLITGDNGAGKSTLIDGLMALLLPAGRASFNMAAAQGDSSDRTLISYMRGSFGSTHDGGSTRIKSKREGAVVTALRATFEQQLSGGHTQTITLAAVFWTTQATNALSDIKRIYLVATRNLSLEELLKAFGEGNARTLKQFLRSDDQIHHCADNFSEYQALYRRHLYMENKNAPALLARALGLKKIDDLTGLIRDLVLEPSNVKQDARQVVDEFADLVATHDKLIDAREQRDHLQRLPELNKLLIDAQKELKQLESELHGLTIYIHEQCVSLWQHQIQQLQQQLESINQQLKQLQRQITEANDIVEQRHADYIEAGGDRVEVIKKELEHATARLSAINQLASRYQQEARALKLDDRIEEQQVAQNQALAATKLETIEEERHSAQDRFASISGQFSLQQNESRELTAEIAEIEARPDSNIDLKYQQLRDEMADALELDREQCMFIGELIDVHEEARPWQGAIERALGGLRTTLAVPLNRFSMVTRWLNQRHTGLHVRVQVVKPQHSPTHFKENGFLRKLVWRQHDYREWLKSHLAHFDLHCVASTTELDATPFSMTQQGLIHKEKGRFQKQDLHRIDDRRRWQLGFSNRSRLSALKKELNECEERRAQLQKELAVARQTLNSIGEQERLWRKLGDYRWEEIDAPFWTEKVNRLRQDLTALEQSKGDLAKAKARWDEAKQALKTVQNQRETAISEKGRLESQIDRATEQKNRAAQIAEQGLEESIRQHLTHRVGKLKAEQLDDYTKIERKHQEKLNQQIKRCSDRQGSASREAVGTMSTFRQKWSTIAGDWGADMLSLSDYIEHLEKLIDEGLPVLVEQFKQRLNKNTTQSLARIRSRIDSEREDILERIETINKVLAGTEFRQGTHLKLGAKNEQFPHVQAFYKQLSHVLSQATSEDHEDRFEQLSVVVAILEKASNPTTAHTLESLRLLDPRYQMSFYAEELDAETGDIRDVMLSTSGKSGGEKESFAGTIVAASLAYVLTPDGYDQPIYSTVFLDEAFSNTAETVSRRVLRVFRELNIHVNLITPYKNHNLARESASSLIIAERDPQAHESRLCEVTWEEIDRQLDQKRRAALGEFNIELEGV